MRPTWAPRSGGRSVGRDGRRVPVVAVGVQVHRRAARAQCGDRDHGRDGRVATAPPGLHPSALRAPRTGAVRAGTGRLEVRSRGEQFGSGSRPRRGHRDQGETYQQPFGGHEPRAVSRAHRAFAGVAGQPLAPQGGGDAVPAAWRCPPAARTEVRPPARPPRPSPPPAGPSSAAPVRRCAAGRVRERRRPRHGRDARRSPATTAKAGRGRPCPASASPPPPDGAGRSGRASRIVSSTKSARGSGRSYAASSRSAGIAPDCLSRQCVRISFMAIATSQERKRSGSRSSGRPRSIRSTVSCTTSSTSAWPSSARPTTLYSSGRYAETSWSLACWSPPCAAAIKTVG